MQVFIEQCATADEKLQLSAEVFTDFREKHVVEQAHERFQQESDTTSLIFSAVSVIDVSHFEGKVEQTGYILALGTDALFDILFEIQMCIRDRALRLPTVRFIPTRFSKLRMNRLKYPRSVSCPLEMCIRDRPQRIHNRYLL